MTNLAPIAFPHERIFPYPRPSIQITIIMPSEPTALSLQPDGKLVIEWSDGRRRRYEIGELRQKCPCATCLYERESASRTVDVAKDAPPLALADVHPVGNYAYNIQFSDGHGTGIYPLELL